MGVYGVLRMSRSRWGGISVKDPTLTLLTETQQPTSKCRLLQSSSPSSIIPSCAEERHSSEIWRAQTKRRPPGKLRIYALLYGARRKY